MSQTVTDSGYGQFSPLNRVEGNVHPINTTRGQIVWFSAGLTSFLYLFIKSETGVVNVGCVSIARVAFYCTATTLFHSSAGFYPIH